MNAAGTDVSSTKSMLEVLRPFGEVVCLSFDVAHNTEGLVSLVEQLKVLDGETRVVMEHTGRFPLRFKAQKGTKQGCPCRSYTKFFRIYLEQANYTAREAKKAQPFTSTLFR